MSSDESGAASTKSTPPIPHAVMTDDRHQIPAASWERDVYQMCSELNIYETSDLKGGESQIRLLSIAKADDFDQPLVVQLVVNSLNDPASLKYVALSYVWEGIGPTTRSLSGGPSRPTRSYWGVPPRRYEGIRGIRGIGEGIGPGNK
jgi:hypothetical protein